MYCRNKTKSPATTTSCEGGLSYNNTKHETFLQIKAAMHLKWKTEFNSQHSLETELVMNGALSHHSSSSHLMIKTTPAHQLTLNKGINSTQNDN